MMSCDAAVMICLTIVKTTATHMREREKGMCWLRVDIVRRCEGARVYTHKPLILTTLVCTT